MVGGAKKLRYKSVENQRLAEKNYVLQHKKVVKIFGGLVKKV